MSNLAERLRAELVVRRESFAFETVLSDPVGEKVNWLQRTAQAGYLVVLCFIGLDSATESHARVALRVTRGGHDVPTDKLLARYLRTLNNLARTLQDLPCVLVYNNSDLARPYRFVAEYRDAGTARVADELPAWFPAQTQRRDA